MYQTHVVVYGNLCYLLVRIFIDSWYLSYVNISLLSKEHLYMWSILWLLCDLIMNTLICYIYIYICVWKCHHCVEHSRGRILTTSATYSLCIYIYIYIYALAIPTCNFMFVLAFLNQTTSVYSFVYGHTHSRYASLLVSNIIVSKRICICFDRSLRC